LALPFSYFNQQTWHKSNDKEAYQRNIVIQIAVLLE
jgi:hypothetical protein